MIIDGSYGEGGGQILRTSLSLAAILNRPVEIINIRSHRRRPGLQPQHLTAVQAVAAITRARVTGAEFGSQRLVFRPGELTGGEYEFDVSAVKSSAGSVSLIFQAVAPPLFVASESSRLMLKGGTHVSWSPPTTYLRSVFLPTLGKLGVRAQLETIRWGWYPKGGGVANAEINPTRELLPQVLVARGGLRRIECLSVVSNLPPSIAERQRNRVLRRLEQRGLSATCDLFEAPSIGQGTLLFLLAGYQQGVAGFSALGAPGKPAERVADEAVAEFWAHHQSTAAVDKHLADQLLLCLALANGRSRFSTSEVTQHLLTNIWVIEQFLPVKFKVEGDIGQPGLVAVEV